MSLHEKGYLMDIDPSDQAHYGPWTEKQLAAFQRAEEHKAMMHRPLLDVLFGDPQPSWQPGVVGVPPPDPIDRAPLVDRFLKLASTKYPPWPAQVPSVVKTVAGAVSSLGIPTEAHDAPLTREQWAVAHSYKPAAPHPDRLWFANVYEAQLKRRISLATTKLWEYFTFPLRDRAGAYHYSRLATPWVYYKDLNVYDLFQVFVSPLVTAAVIASAAWILGTWAPAFLAALAAPAFAEKCVRVLSEAVTTLLKRKIRVPREIRDALAITSEDVYDGSIRTRLPGITYSPDTSLDSSVRNLALEFPENLFSQRGMNKTVTFRTIRPCH